MQYFKDEIGSTGVLFLQEIHSDSDVKQNGKRTLKAKFFSYIKFLTGVLTAYFGAETFTVKK